MKKFVKESGQGLVEYALILVLICIVVIAVLMSIRVPRDRFVDALDAGTVQIIGTQIALGESGHPQPVDPEIKVVNYPLGPSTSLENYPQKYLVTGCMNLYMTEADTQLYAATPVIEDVALFIDIQAPANSGGYVQICVPDGLTDVPVYLWSKQVEP